MRKLYYILFCILIFVSCKTTLNINKVEKKEPVIIMKKTSCKGKCPVYEAFFYSEGIIVLNAKENFKFIGKYYLQVNRNDIRKLVHVFMKNNFFSFDDEYKSMKTDLPATYLTFNYQGKSKMIKDYSDAPIELNELENMLLKYIEQENWIKFKE